MNETKPPGPELRGLIDLMLDERPLTTHEAARLETLLENEDAMAYYLRVTQQEVEVEVALRGMAADPGGEIPRFTHAPPRSRWRTVGRVAAVALIFGAGFLANPLFTPTPVAPDGEVVENPPEPQSPAARITGMLGVVWNKSAEPDLLSVGATARRLAFESGLLELTFSNGVKVTLEGPADFRVVDAKSATLLDGRLVASVPPGGEGFTVDYGGGKVVDFGTEFGIATTKHGGTKVGVFEGRVELRPTGQEAPVSLVKNQAVFHDPENGHSLTAIDLGREKFTRRLPSREFTFSLSSYQPVERSFDVSHLVRRASQFRVIIKWLNGDNPFHVGRVDLLCDGAVVASDQHLGTTGYYTVVSDNLYRLDLSESAYRKGRWEVRVDLAIQPDKDRDTVTPGCNGILHFEEGLVSDAMDADFVGAWTYRFEGSTWVREFRPDGSCNLYRDGTRLANCFIGSRWSVVDGVLCVTIPERGSVEEHVLRDRNTLIFKSQPYENARRIRWEQ